MTEPKNNPQVCAPEQIKIGPFKFFVEVCRSRYHRHYKENKPQLVLDIALVSIMLILAGVMVNTFFFNRAPIVNLVSLNLSTTPRVLVNGAQANFDITYTNTTGDTMNDVSLVLRVPKGLRNAQFTPATYNRATNTLDIGELKAKDHGVVSVNGVLFGNMGQHERILAVVNYKDKFGRSRQEFSTLEAALDRSLFETSLSIPNKLTSGSPFDGTLTLKNGMLVDFDAVTVSFSGPENFKILSTDLKPGTAAGTYVASVKSGQELTVNFRGYATTKTPGTTQVTAQVHATFEGRDYIVGAVTEERPLVYSNFILRFTENETSPKHIAPSEAVTIHVYYKNAEPFAVKDVRLGLRADGEFVDTVDLRARYGNRVSGGSVSWDSAAKPELAEIASGKEGGFDVTVAARPSIQYARDTESQQIMLTATSHYTEAADGERRVSVESVPLTLPVDTRLSMNTNGLFYSSYGDQIGVGPVPPQVGEYTSYFAVIRLTNTANPVGGAVLRAELPAWAEFTRRDSATIGDHAVLDGNTITWNIGTIPAYAGIFSASPELRMEIAIEPGSEWVNKIVPLLKNIVLTGIDQRTSSALTVRGADITTAIFKDEHLNRVVQ